MNSTLNIVVRAERLPLKAPFRISWIEFHHAQAIVVEIGDGTHIGRGESEPHEYDPEVMAEVVQEIEALPPDALDRVTIAGLPLSRPARNAIDCALWDLEAKRTGVPVWQNAGLAEPQPLRTVWTIGINEPEVMASEVTARRSWNAFKLKLGGGDIADDVARVGAVRAARPHADLIVDANMAWSMPFLVEIVPLLADLRVCLIEQPLPPDQDSLLLHYKGAIPLCADESCLDRTSLPDVIGRYSHINIKLDKTGGLTEALALAREARALGLGIMTGCMIGTSLAMAPAHLVGQLAQYVDLDAPLLLSQDREEAMRYADGMVYPPQARLWG